MSEPFAWGRGQGCDFLDGVCMNHQGQPNFREFCSVDVPQGCTFTARSAGNCNSDDTFDDGCYYYAGYSNLDCENPANQASAWFQEETYEPTSRCFEGDSN